MQFMAGLKRNGHTVANSCRHFAPTLMRIVLIIVGLLALVLGVIGIFLPVMPTVPFVLLAAACFSRASTRMHGWLVRLPFAGKVIDDFEKGRGVSRRAKLSALLMLWTGMTISALLIAPPPLVLALLASIAIGASLIIVRLPKERPLRDESPIGTDAEKTQQKI